MAGRSGHHWQHLRSTTEHHRSGNLHRHQRSLTRTELHPGRDPTPTRAANNRHSQFSSSHPDLILTKKQQSLLAVDRQRAARLISFTIYLSLPGASLLLSRCDGSRRPLRNHSRRTSARQNLQRVVLEQTKTDEVTLIASSTSACAQHRRCSQTRRRPSSPPSLPPRCPTQRSSLNNSSNCRVRKKSKQVSPHSLSAGSGLVWILLGNFVNLGLIMVVTGWVATLLYTHTHTHNLKIGLKQAISIL